MQKTMRESNFEFLRIVCMLMIITLHLLGHGGALNNITIGSINFSIAHFLESLSIVAVNCYLLISGYFGITSNFNLKKAFNLYLMTLFYSVMISTAFWIIGIENISARGLFSMSFPILTQTWWFMSIFLVLYLLTPYINKLLNSLTYCEFNKLLLILFLIFVLWPSFMIFKPIDNLNGYSLYSFIILYTFGAYIRIYFKNKSHNKFLLMGGYLLFTSILAILNISVSNVLGYNWGIYSYNFVLVFLSSISLFLFFKQLHFKNKIINNISSLTLGVYLIHDHPYVREYIYIIFNYDQTFNSIYFFFYSLVIVIIIFAISAFIECFRKIIFTNSYLPKFKKICITKLNEIDSNLL